MSRIVVFGAGAVGSAIGARLHLAGHEVSLVARGRQLERLARQGLEFVSPEGIERLWIPAVADISDLPDPPDLVIVTVKSQDSDAACRSLAATLPTTIPMACVQNGVANEGLFLRQFDVVLGVLVLVPATLLVPGRVEIHMRGLSGALDAGGIGSATTSTEAQEFCRVVGSAGFSSELREDIMAWKYTKLLHNVGNAVDACIGRTAEMRDYYREQARLEAIACFRAANISWVDEDRLRRRREALPPLEPIYGSPRAANSSVQSLLRGSGETESDYLNGEIVYLGRLHGVSTPMNAALQQLMRRLVVERRAPGSISGDEFAFALSRGGDPSR